MTHPSNAESANSPGSLTTVMRAATHTSGTRVLRVGVVQGGKVLAERILAEREHVTIGPNEGATFLVPGSHVPPSFRLFESEGDHYWLQFTDHMSGRVALSTGAVELSALRESAHSVASSVGASPVHRLRLPHEARGKISIGDVTFLFQLIPAIPPAARARLPASLKGGLGDVDWRTSVIAAFSFLFHFGAVGSIYSDWLDPVVDDEVEAAQLMESVKQLPTPPPLEHPKDPAPTQASSAKAQDTSKPNPTGGGGRVAVAGPAGGGGDRGEARAHQISSQLAALELQVLTGLNSNGPATSAVLSSSGDLPRGMLDAAAASSVGARSTGLPGIDLTAGGGPLVPGRLGRGPIPFDTAPSPTGAGTAVAVRPPSGNVGVPGPIVTGGTLLNPGPPVAAMTPGFRRCYVNGLTREDPTMKGSVRLTLRIGPNGEVLSVSASSSGTLSPTVVGCIRNRAASAQFSPPDGGGAVLVVPVTLIPQ